MTVESPLKKRRKILSAVWLGSFGATAFSLGILFVFGFIGKQKFLSTLESVVRVYSPILGVVAAFLLGRVAKARQLRWRPAFVGALFFSVIWTLCMFFGLVALWRGFIAVEEAGDYLEQVEKSLSFLTTGFVAWYLGSEE